ncbi:hypothetical protein [Streptomyces sp. WAC06614]|uniref:hypothetical protein n=1 Tax=Streptomyces sp. WAC06614 TaxID=2487416 RepID=UPI000F77A9B3|nr:hypothetical protein [Streptomyces sp. WAC06614]RSS79390.1 hypothetical protein EF918_17600 [Streptomyces sp. WAC06614]
MPNLKPNLKWVKPGRDLTVTCKGKIPRTVPEIVQTAKVDWAWINLFDDYCAFYAPNLEKEYAKFRLFAALRKKGRTYEQALEESQVRDLLPFWGDMVEAGFSPACEEIKSWLTQEAKAIANGLHGAGRPLKGKELNRAVENMLSQEANRAVLEEQARTVEAQHGSAAPPLDVTLAYVEGTLAAMRESLQPQVEKVGSTFAKAGLGQADYMVRLVTVHEGLRAPEAALRACCLTLRQMNPADRTQDELITCWLAYTEQLQELWRAMAEVASGFMQWSEKDTRKKLKDNFESAYPGVAAALLAVRGLIVAGGAIVTVLAAFSGVGIPVAVATAATTASGLGQKCLDAIEKFTKDAVVGTDAKNLDTQRAHTGRNYRERPSRKVDSSAVERGNEVFQSVVEAGTGAAELASAGGDGVMGFMGSVPGIGTLIEGAATLADRKVLQDDRDRNEQLAAWDLAVEGTEREDGTVVVSGLDPAAGTAQLVVNGRSGTLVNGRFSPTDRSAGLAAALNSWCKSKGNRTHSLRVADPWTFAGLTMQRFNILHGGQLADPGTVASAVTLLDETEEGFVCRAQACGFGLDSRVKDCWTIYFLVTPEGKVRLRKEPAPTFEWAGFDTEGDPAVTVFAWGEEDVKDLLQIRSWDEGLECIRLAKQAYRSEDPTHFWLRDRTIRDAQDREVASLDTIQQLTQQLFEKVEDLGHELEAGVARLVDWGHPYIRDILGQWEIPLQHYWQLKELEKDYVGDALDEQRSLLFDEWKAGPQEKLLVPFVNNDDALAQSIVRGQHLSLEKQGMV